MFPARLPTSRARSLTLAGIAAVAGAAAATHLAPANAQLLGGSPSTSQSQLGPSFADLVDKVKPSVVSISVTNGSDRAKVAGANPPRGGGGERGERGFPGIPDLPEDHPLNELFKNLPRGPESGPRPSLAQGSGFVISADGYVVTNNHVIDNASKITVSFGEKEKFEADLIGTDQRTDLALLKIKGDRKDFKPVKFAAKPGRVGEWVFAVGNPFGLGGTVTAGIISAFGRDIGSGPYDFMQIDAAVNRGNSGGPTFNLDGEVVGVNTAIYSPSGGNVGIAFAIPAKTASEVVQQLREKGTVNRGWLGVKIQNIDEDTAASIGLPEPRGALVSEITPNGPAAGSEMKAQDAILMVNGDKIADSRDLARKIAELAPNTVVDVTVWRNNAEKVVKVTLGTFPGGKQDPAKPDVPKAVPKSSFDLSELGVTLMPAKTGAKAEGVVIAEVKAGSDAAAKGLKAGDIILQVSGENVTTPEDVVAGVKKAQEMKRRAVLLHIKSADSKRFVPVQLKAG